MLVLGKWCSQTVISWVCKFKLLLTLRFSRKIIAQPLDCLRSIRAKDAHCLGNVTLRSCADGSKIGLKILVFGSISFGDLEESVVWSYG